jgi:hypothetical protein
MREARRLGYKLLVGEASNSEPVTHVAAAAISGQASFRFLAYGTSAAEAAGNGLAVLRGIVERGDRWPEA